MLISFIDFLTAIVWRLIKLLLSLIMAGVSFVVFVFMLLCVLIILYSGKDPTIWNRGAQDDDNNN